MAHEETTTIEAVEQYRCKRPKTEERTKHCNTCTGRQPYTRCKWIEIVIVYQRKKKE